MRRLLQNLISNALKYTSSGRVLVGCRRAPGAARIEVWDTGLGIAPEHERTVFAEFKRLDQGARMAPGLGLGLSIVERLGRVLEHPVGLALSPGQGLGVLRHCAARTGDALSAAQRRARPILLQPANRSPDSRFWPSTTTPAYWRVCVFSSSAGAAGSQPPMGLKRPRRRSTRSARPTSSSPIITWIRATASPRSKRCASALAEALAAILVTADRSPEVRDEAARADVVFMNKPLKPAPLRAQLTRYSAMREAAE